MSADPSHWLHRYGNAEFYKWRTTTTTKGSSGPTTYYRPLGLVESAFDSDGRFFEGRADMNLQLDLEVKSNLDFHDLRERILYAWAALRCKHLLVQAKAVPKASLVEGENEELCFAVDAPRTAGQAVEDGGRHIVFLEDHFAHVDAQDFWMHCQNTARIVDPDDALAKLFVLPLEKLSNGHFALRLLMVCSHQICDGMAMTTWLRSLTHYLNTPLPELRSQMTQLLQHDSLFPRLPQAQEALYPPIPGNRARQRWFWLLSRILRHVRRPLPAAFPNPLQRTHPRTSAIPFSPVYGPILDYSRTPRLNTFPCVAKTSHGATQHLHRLCREAGTSIGAGCFALAAALQMEFYERRHPNVPLDDRQPFTTGFPLNPRAFFNHHIDPDSLMLAFSDGIRLNFLPSHLSIAGRIKLLARQAHRQLAVFQKRAGTRLDEAGVEYMGSRGAGRLLPVHYLFSIERWQAKFPAGSPQRRMQDPQGAYPMRPNAGGQTCGVSSVGTKVAVLRRGMYSLESEGDFVADFRSSRAAVRPRDDEFLIGVGGDDVSAIGMNTSVDANAIDPVLAREFCRRCEEILEVDENAKL